MKRRPSTKKGRDAMRNTCSDFSFIRNSTAEDCENEANDVNPNEKLSSKSELQAKTTEHPKLISTPSQHTSIEKKQSPRYAFPRQHVKETYQVNIIRPKYDLSPDQRINYSDMKLGLHNAVKSEYIPKIVVETSRSVEGNNRVSEFKSHLNGKNDDILTYSTTAEKVTNKTEDSRRLPEISPSRSRRFERWHEFKPQQTQQTTFKSEVSMKLNQNLGDVPQITVSSSVSSNITDFMNELITDEKSLDKAIQDGITQSRTTTNFLRRSEYVTKLSKTSSFKRTDFLNELDSIYNSSGNKDRKGIGDNITSTSIVKQSEKNDNGIEVQEETLNSYSTTNEYKVEMCPNGATLVNESRKTEDSFKSTVETSYKKTTPKNVVSRSETSLSANSKDYLIVDPETSGPFDVSRRSSFVKTDNFASPEFIKENLSEDEEGEDVFSEKKLPPQSDMLKRSTLDDDEEDLLEEESKDKKTGIF